MSKPRDLHLAQHPMSELEVYLNSLEPSWADFLYGVRVGARFTRGTARDGMRVRSLKAVHEFLEQYQARFTKGETVVLWLALLYCIEENVPLPYWLGDALLAINTKVQDEPSSLHDQFGMGTMLPADGKRARKARTDAKLQKELWYTATESIAESKRAGSAMSINKAIKSAMDALRFPYAKTKAREMFDAQERIQSAHPAARKYVKSIRFKK